MKNKYFRSQKIKAQRRDKMSKGEIKRGVETLLPTPTSFYPTKNVHSLNESERCSMMSQTSLCLPDGISHYGEHASFIQQKKEEPC